MNSDEYQQMYDLESHYWWFVARRYLIRKFVRDVVEGIENPTLLDVGCGTGINQTEFAEFGRSLGVDVSESALAFSRKRGVDNLLRSNLQSLALESESVDLITALDVLEHISDDMRGMAEMRRVLRPNGALVITVPAYAFLWSEHDEALHHHRRYVASELRNKLTLSGFDVERVSYFITSLFLPIFLTRFAQSVFKKSAQPKTSHILVPRWLNSLLILVLRVETKLLRVINFPFGVSILCIARKRGSAAADEPTPARDSLDVAALPRSTQTTP